MMHAPVRATAETHGLLSVTAPRLLLPFLPFLLPFPLLPFPLPIFFVDVADANDDVLLLLLLVLLSASIPRV